MSPHPRHVPIQDDDAPPPDLAPLNIIRTETVLSRLPLHNLSKKGRVDIHILHKNAHGDIELRWEVSYNEKYGPARQLAYRLDTLLINRCLEAYHRPLPQVIRLGSLAEIAAQFNLRRDTNSVKKALLQNAATFIAAKLRYTATDGTEHTLEAGFTRYSVVFTGERLPDGRTADAVYLILHDPYAQVLNHAPTRPLDYDYLQALSPAAQRCYEIISYKLFAALKYQQPEAKVLYSEYCTFAAQQRYADYPHVKKQMYKVHKPHLTSGYLARVRYEATTDAEGHPDWLMAYVPGPKARAEYAAFNGRQRRRPPHAPAAPLGAVADEALTTPSPTADEALRTQAQALVQHFHQRFHGTADVVPVTSKALAQAHDLIAQYGLDQARHVVDFSITAAHETDYSPQTFGGILQYTARALADYAQTQQRLTAEARARDERHRAQEDAQLRRQYEDYCAARLAELRATTPPDVLAAVEAAAAAHFDRDHPSPFGRDLLRRYAMDDAVAAHFQIPSLEAWHATQGRS